MTQPNSTNFQTNPPRDHSENYPFFQQNKNKKQTSYQMDYLSSDDDFYNQIYLHQILKNIVDKEYRKHVQIIGIFLHNR